MRRLVVCLLLLLACAHGPAYADDLDDAEAQATAGDKAAARTSLTRWLDDEEEARGAEALLRAAQVARALPDIDLVNAVRARAEALEATLEKAPPALDLALGFAYLGLAEESLRLNTGSRVISFYFADATTRADRVPADSPLGETAARLAAGSLYAQGDLAGAVQRLAAHREAVDTVSPRFEALAGRLRYDQGAAMPLQASGHVTPEARALLASAVTSLALAADTETLHARIRRSSRLRLAWAKHRLGNIAEADAAYRATYATGSPEAPMALRGLASLYARDLPKLLAALEAIAAAYPRDTGPLDALRIAHFGNVDPVSGLKVANRRLEIAPEDPESWYRAGYILQGLGLMTGALNHFAAALQRDPSYLVASGNTEMIAQGYSKSDPERACAIYERLLKLRPRDPYVRNNYGFILRDLVSRHTMKLGGGIERIEVGAPAGMLGHLKRCIEVYAEATALIDPENDVDLDEANAWNLAGIINDYGLMLHYFIDVQDAGLAEQQYLRALQMTDYSFKDTYSPNLQRLYGFVLTSGDRDWRWFRIAREAKEAILREELDSDGATVLVPDEGKRAAARRDMTAARARIMQALALDDEDGR